MSLEQVRFATADVAYVNGCPLTLEARIVIAWQNNLVESIDYLKFRVRMLALRLPIDSRPRP